MTFSKLAAAVPTAVPTEAATKLPHTGALLCPSLRSGTVSGAEHPSWGCRSDTCPPGPAHLCVPVPTAVPSPPRSGQLRPL